MALAAATIDGIRMVPQNISPVPRLLIEGEPGMTITIEYSEAVQSRAWKALTKVVVTNNPHAFVDLTAAGVAKRFYRLVASADSTNPNPARLVWIPPGTFAMGSPAAEKDRFDWEGPQMEVTLTQGFYMGKYEVTQREYLELMGKNPSYFVGGRELTFLPPDLRPPPLTEDLNRPVDEVTWFDAVSYCSKLTQQERAAGRLPAEWEYRLPTEAEWEYACRAGTTTRYYYGDDLSYSEVRNYAWITANSGYTTHPVGEKPANEWGLHDMAGNIGEWCLDWYGSYPGGSLTDPKGPSTGFTRVVRGGNWFFFEVHSRSAYRYYLFPDYTPGYIGFRVVLARSQP
ncbi:MAG: formylglycine-generating enzyme family protein [Verrucomicrobia bacterium]|nr:formylglycine-generating enzyme family protein [Verrucomicrobiota bacterium]